MYKTFGKSIIYGLAILILSLSFSAAPSSILGQLLPRRSSESAEPTPKKPTTIENTASENKRFGQRLLERLKQTNEGEKEPEPKLDEKDEKKAGQPKKPVLPPQKAPPIIVDPNLTYDLTSKRSSGSTDVVEILLELGGKAKQVTSDQEEIAEDLFMQAGFQYEERLISDPAQSKDKLKSVREYSLAKAIINIGSVKTVPKLDQKHKVIVCEIDGKETTFFSPQGALKSEQIMLVEGVLGNTLGLDQLLPSEKVKIGDSWKIPNEAIYSLLDIDAISNQNLEATLTSVAEDLAMVEIVGDTQGAYLGSLSDMTVHAKYQFDLKLGRINWVGMLIKEDRSISDVGPGLDIKAKLQVKIVPLEKPSVLTDKFLDNFSLDPKGDELLIRYDGGEGPWRFHFTRNWYLIEDIKGNTILRMLNDSGELVAQCSMVSMPPIDTKSPTTLADFSDNLKRGLGNSFGAIASADESVNSAGYEELRVIIDGSVEDLPLRWVYYLVTDDRGNQAVVVFVIHPDKLQQFGASDELILDSFRMIDVAALPNL